jgi:hypothetical protein
MAMTPADAMMTAAVIMNNCLDILASLTPTAVEWALEEHAFWSGCQKVDPIAQDSQASLRALQSLRLGDDNCQTHGSALEN